ncbi:hypothetical protein [Vibrio metschnikovii]|uniref:hypothetical protein n=1 Tax=Vibrio metschnikovii TaxID=28172 RepID=UPI001C305A11|nr:hypothetical protein [Vibrio metschnikovii]
MGKLGSWLKGQLTSIKGNTDAWRDLASSIGYLLEKYSENYIERLKTRSSMFDMQPDDLQTEIRELGEFFQFGDVPEQDLPMVVIQRKDQIHLKKTVYPLEATLRREFAGMNVSWQPLYAPVDTKRHPYGSVLMTANDIDMSVSNDWFMTSRGVIQVPINKIRVNDEQTLRDFEEKIRRVVYPLVPLRIVMQGTSYYLHFELFDCLEWVTQGVMSVVERININDLDPDPVFLQKIFMDWYASDFPQKFPKRQGVTRMDMVATDTTRIDRNFFVVEKAWRTFLKNAVESTAFELNHARQRQLNYEALESSDTKSKVELGTKKIEDKPRPFPNNQARTRLDVVRADTVRIDKNFFVYEKLFHFEINDKRHTLDITYVQPVQKPICNSEANETLACTFMVQLTHQPKELGLTKQAGLSKARLDESPVDSLRLDTRV